MITVNDLIGLNYSNLRNPPTPTSGINTLQPTFNFNTQIPNLDYNLQPQMMNENNLFPSMDVNQQPILANTTGIAPLITPPADDDYESIQMDTRIKPQKTGIKSLLNLAARFAVPGLGFIMNAPQNLVGLNRRIRQSDFGRSKNLMDYLDAKKYGGIDARNRAASKTMREARAIQKQLDLRTATGKYNDGGDRGRGQTPTRSTSTSKAASPRQSRQTSGAGGLHSY